MAATMVAAILTEMPQVRLQEISHYQYPNQGLEVAILVSPMVAGVLGQM
jgi:hypothetical protein